MKCLPCLSSWVLLSAFCASISAATISLDQAYTDSFGEAGAVSSSDGLGDAGGAMEVSGKANAARAAGDGTTLVTTAIGTFWEGGVPPKLLTPSTGAVSGGTAALTGTTDTGDTAIAGTSTEIGTVAADDTQLVNLILADSGNPQGALTTSTPSSGAVSRTSFGSPIVEIAKVSEPSVLALLGLGAFGLALLRRRT